MSKLIIISNRLPVNISRQKGKFIYNESVGGVATGINSLSEPKERVWFGWPGILSDRLKSQDKTEITKNLTKRGCRPVFLNQKDHSGFYSGFSNNTIWPLFHYFSEFTVYEQSNWECYKKVNKLFCDQIVDHIEDDDIVWVHDYQLMLLPQMIREKKPNAKIGFFLHIPFPSFELIRQLPWREEILEGILGSDLIGFHEYDYVRHFLSSVYRICRHEHQLNKLVIDGRYVRVDAFPMGINYEKYVNSKNLPEVQKHIKRLDHSDKQIILSVDRLDYSKGIIHRLEAYDWFLTKYPQYRGKVCLAMVVVPSRTNVEQYNVLREQIEKTVGRINGEYGTLDWTPVSYFYRSLPFERLSGLYNVADAALITPLRDGMNLVAKEFIATQDGKEKQGILILSEMAGAACELSEAIVVNPHDKEQIVEAIKEAIDMPQDERFIRNKMMQSRVSRYTVGRWAKEFLQGLGNIIDEQNNLATKKLTPKKQEDVLLNYKSAKKRLILLDYDGTLVKFYKLPEDAMPDEELLNIITTLAKDKKNEVVVISGRDRETLCSWLGKLNINLVAEHGAFFKIKGQEWQTSVSTDNSWKDVILPVLELSVDRTPGSFVEQKKSSLVWHFRKSDPDLAKLRTQELKDTLVMMAGNLNIGVFEGNKIIEIKPVSINKGQATRDWLAKNKWDFVFCAGDDYTDEDMFSVLPETAVSCKIGTGLSNARYSLAGPDSLRKFLCNITSKK